MNTEHNVLSTEDYINILRTRISMIDDRINFHTERARDLHDQRGKLLVRFAIARNEGMESLIKRDEDRLISDIKSGKVTVHRADTGDEISIPIINDLFD